VPETIPPDVYYSAAEMNFYHIETGRGMGNHFYEKWKSRWAEFPDKPAPPISHCPDCGEFRGHGHEDVCPMAWVEITDPDHVLRKDVDQWGTGGLDWKYIHGLSGSTIAEERERECGDFTVRCRRKDLPPVPSPAKTKTLLRLFVNKYITRNGGQTQQLFVALNESPLSWGTMHEVHGLQIYIEDPSASGSGDAAE
jgi:hypothetical protein